MKKTQTILIIGSTGFLGHLAKVCLENNYKVFGISRLPVKKIKELKRLIIFTAIYQRRVY